MEETKGLTTTALMVAISAAMALMMYFMPLIQGLVFVVGVPMILVGVKYGYRNLGLGLLATGLILLFINPMYALTVLFTVGPISGVITYCINHKKDNSYTIFVSGIAVFFSMLLLLVVIQNLFDVDLIDQTSKLIDTTVEEVSSLYLEGDLLSQEDKTIMVETLEKQSADMKMLLPSFLILYGMINGLLTFLITKAVFKRMGMPLKSSKFKDFRIGEDKRSILLIVMMVVTLGAIVDKTHGELYIVNFTSILLVVLQINGLALVWFKTDKKANKKFLRLVMCLVYVLSVGLGGLGLILRYGLSIVGFLDMHMNFRKRVKKIDKPQE